MRLIKQTKENKQGISMKDLSFFPSREWGPEGGVEAKMYLHGKYVGKFYNAGDGGCAEFWADPKVSKETLNKFWDAVLKSVPEKYRTGDFAILYKNKTKADPDDIMMFVDDMVEEKGMTR